MKEKADEIIRSHVIFSMTAGAIPIPLADIAAVTAIQIDMIKQLAQNFSINYDENKGKSFATSLAGATFATIGASIVKAIPGVGSLIGIGTQIVLSGASTYALGNIFSRHFAEGGTLLNAEIDKMKESYRELLSKGKEIAKDIRKGLKKDDSLRTIEKLKDLLDKGAISEKDFNETKKKMLEKISGM